MVFQPSQIDIATATAGLSPAFSRSEVHHASEWVAKCVSDQAQLWKHGDLWAVTEVRLTKTGRIVNIVAIAGEFDDALIGEIEQWAVSVGCNKAFFTGRKGWLRRMRDYRITTITMVKELEHA